jgi:hypothetical protein
MKRLTLPPPHCPEGLMKHAVKHIHFVGVVAASREQGSRLRDATGREWRRMPTEELDKRVTDR